MPFRVSVSPLKIGLLLAWLAALGVMWSYRAPVTAAYATEREPVDLQLASLDLSVRSVSESDSPYDLDVAPNTRSVPLPYLALDPRGPSAPPVVMTGGSARLRGSVLRGSEPVPGATVRISRITAEGRAEQDLVTTNEGRWNIEGLLGGRYRVRAFVPFDMGSANTSVIFMPQGAEQEISLQVTQPNADTIFGIAGPEEIFVGQQATVGVTVGLRQVDATGRVVVDPLPGAVVVAAIGPPAELLSANVALADSQGAAAFLIHCSTPGTSSLTADVNGLLGVLTLPPCVVVPEPDPEPVDAG